jgi:hypothetical protein
MSRHLAETGILYSLQVCRDLTDGYMFLGPSYFPQFTSVNIHLSFQKHRRTLSRTRILHCLTSRPISVQVTDLWGRYLVTCLQLRSSSRTDADGNARACRRHTAFDSLGGAKTDAIPGCGWLGSLWIRWGRSTTFCPSPRIRAVTLESGASSAQYLHPQRVTRAGSGARVSSPYLFL